MINFCVVVRRYHRTTTCRCNEGIFSGTCYSSAFCSIHVGLYGAQCLLLFCAVYKYSYLLTLCRPTMQTLPTRTDCGYCILLPTRMRIFCRNLRGLTWTQNFRIRKCLIYTRLRQFLICFLLHGKTDRQTERHRLKTMSASLDQSTVKKTHVSLQSYMFDVGLRRMLRMNYDYSLASILRSTSPLIVRGNVAAELSITEDRIDTV